MESHASLTTYDLGDIQAGPVVPVPTKNKGFLFFGIKNVYEFRRCFGMDILPHVTTSLDARNIRETVYKAKAAGQMAPVTGITVAFSQKGLTLLSLVADIQDPAFKQGQLARAQSLGDDKDKWLPDFKRTPIHGLFEVTGYPEEQVKEYIRDKIKDPLSGYIDVIFEHYGKVRPGKQKDHEHFGYNDGISQPFVKFEDDGEHRVPLPGQNVVNPGVIILGQTGDEHKSQRPGWAFNGSFLVYRHLKQRVPEFDDFLRKTVLRSIVNPLPHTLTDPDFQKRVDFLGARLMGRWKSGCPVVLTPKAKGEFPVDIPEIGHDPQRNNDFDYGPRDGSARQQFLCPFAAHTRKTGPRTDIRPENVEKFSISRAGITFGPELTEDEMEPPFLTLRPRGLSFVCFQSALENGFEFIQKSWANDIDFPSNTGPGVHPGFDPIVGQKQGKPREMIGYDVDDLSKQLKIPTDFVIAQGGEYFFLPSMTTLREIGNIV